MKIEHVLGKPSPSQNVWESMHWRKRNKFIHNMTWALRHARGLAPKADAPVLVVVQRFSHKPLDPDNVVGGCKGILDAIVHAGLAVDDASRWMARRYEQHRTTTIKTRRTVITIEPRPADTAALSFDEFGFDPVPEQYQRAIFTA